MEVIIKTKFRNKKRQYYNRKIHKSSGEVFSNNMDRLLSK